MKTIILAIDPGFRFIGLATVEFQRGKTPVVKRTERIEVNVPKDGFGKSCQEIVTRVIAVKLADDPEYLAVESFRLFKGPRLHTKMKHHQVHKLIGASQRDIGERPSSQVVQWMKKLIRILKEIGDKYFPDKTWLLDEHKIKNLIVGGTPRLQHSKKTTHRFMKNFIFHGEIDELSDQNCLDAVAIAVALWFILLEAGFVREKKKRKTKIYKEKGLET